MPDEVKIFDEDNAPLLAEDPQMAIIQLPCLTTPEPTTSIENLSAHSLRDEYLHEFEKLLDGALAEGMSQSVASQGLKAIKKASKSGNKVNFFVTIYQSTMRQHKRRGQIAVNPAALQRRAGPSRSRKAQDRGRPRRIEGRVVKRAKAIRNLAAAVAANRANAISH